MAAIIFIVILIFIIAIQVFLPKFLREREAFGIYIPDTHVKDQRIIHMKNRYTQLILSSGIVILVIFIGWLWMFRPAEDRLFWHGCSN